MPLLHSTVTLAGQLMEGAVVSCTLMLKLQLVEPGSLQLTGVALPPAHTTGKALPLAGVQLTVPPLAGAGLL